MRAKFTTPLILVTLATVPACVTSRSDRPTPHGSVTARSTAPTAKTKALAKPGQKATPAEAAESSPVQTREAAPTKADLTRIFDRLNDPTMQLMDEDVRSTAALHGAAKGSIEEAVMILAQLRLLKIQADETRKFQSHDLHEPAQEKDPGKGLAEGPVSPAKEAPATAPAVEGPAPSQQLSMENRFREHGIDLVSTFEQNSYLKNLSTLALVKALLENTQNTAQFQGGMQSIIDAEAQKWAALQKSLKQDNTPAGAEANAAVAAVPAPESPPAAAPPLTATPDPHLAPVDLKRSDTILMQSQRLADKGEFKQAIDQASRIDDHDPFFDQAKEKIKIYSNRAVQDLRQKAAQAFQNAMPVADSRAKAAYLKHAKELLEQALKDYPVADQLDTVRENLSVITRDLSGIDPELGDNKPKTQ